MSVSVTNRVSISAWFMPTPIARTHPSRAELLQRRVRLAQGLLAVVVGIVDERDVDLVEAEPVQAGLQAAPDAVGAEVEHAACVRGHGEALGRSVRPYGGPATGVEQPADLGGDHVLVARPVPQGLAEAPLGQAEAVVRRGVEGPDAAVPGGVDRGPAPSSSSTAVNRLPIAAPPNESSVTNTGDAPSWRSRCGERLIAGAWS